MGRKKVDRGLALFREAGEGARQLIRDALVIDPTARTGYPPAKRAAAAAARDVLAAETVLYTALEKGVEGSAQFSRCERYRYVLRRWWGGGDYLVWCLLNPSRAGAERNDPTVRRGIGYSKAWGYGGLFFVNLYGLVSTKPAGLWAAEDPVGPVNDVAILSCASGRDVMAAWGANARPDRVDEVRRLLREHARSVSCLGLTKGGHPRHPLRLAALEPVVPYDVG